MYANLTRTRAADVFRALFMAGGLGQKVRGARRARARHDRAGDVTGFVVSSSTLRSLRARCSVPLRDRGVPRRFALVPARLPSPAWRSRGSPHPLARPALTPSAHPRHVPGRRRPPDRPSVDPGPPAGTSASPIVLGSAPDHRPGVSRGCEADVVVVGAGLAGLRAATELSRAGPRGAGPGGRGRGRRTDPHGPGRRLPPRPGLPAPQPGLPRRAALGGPRGAGAPVVRGRGRGTHQRSAADLGPPAAWPTAAARHARRRRPGAGIGHGLLRWLRPLLHRPGTTARAAVERGTDRSLRDSLDGAGVHGLLRRVLDAFFAGVVLEDDGRTSPPSRCCWPRCSSGARPALPARACRRCRASSPPSSGDRVRLGSPVAPSTGAGVAVDVDGAGPGGPARWWSPPARVPPSG